MSTSTSTLWCCDRCEGEINLPEREQPEWWVRVIRASPPLANPFDSKKRDEWQLCRECSERLSTWMVSP